MSPRKPQEIKTKGLVDPERLRSALELIRDAGPAGIPREDLRVAMGDVSYRTVDRTLALLEGQGARIERVRNGWPSVMHFVLKKGPSWDEHVSTEARLALRLAALSLMQSGTMLWQEKLEVIESLATGKMSSKDRKLFEQLSNAIQVHGGVEDPVEGDSLLEPLLQSFEGPRELNVEYLAAGSKGHSTFKVVPYALTHDLFSGGSFLLVWDSERGRPMHLRLSRIEHLKVGRVSMIPKPEVMERAARYQIGGWMSMEEPFTVEARIEGEHWIQAFKEAPPALPDFEADADGNSVSVRFKANHENGASRWIMQFGPHAEVLKPDWLRSRIHRWLKEATALYDAKK